jgi:hypothetical protein
MFDVTGRNLDVMIQAFVVLVALVLGFFPVAKRRGHCARANVPFAIVVVPFVIVIIFFFCSSQKPSLR